MFTEFELLAQVYDLLAHVLEACLQLLYALGGLFHVFAEYFEVELG